MMWMVTVQGIEIPVRARSRAALLGRLEEVLGESMAKVDVSQEPVVDPRGLANRGGIRYFRQFVPTSLS